MKAENKEAISTPVIEPNCLPWYRPFLQQLEGLQEQKRLPHAMLLSLPGDSNDLEFIWFLSMFLLCKKRDELNPCGQCTACQLMLANTYPDFKLFTLLPDEKSKKLSKNIKIEQIRNLIQEVYLTRSYDNLKIVVVYPADRMSIAGANSLLKTLEEPASEVLIILATQYVGKIPVTLRSRCQQWQLDLPDHSESINWLKAEGLDSELAEQYLEFAKGDPVLALRLNEISYVDLVQNFKKQFALYLKNQIDVVKLAQLLLAHEALLIRRIVKMVITAYCFQFSGLSAGENSSALTNRKSAQTMIDLLTRTDRQLMIEENNLDIQIQLEDVLISVKQIINRSQQ